MPALVTVEEAAARLAVSAGHVRRLVRAGRLRAVRVGGVVMVPTWAVEAYQQRRAGRVPVRAALALLGVLLAVAARAQDVGPPGDLSPLDWMVCAYYMRPGDLELQARFDSFHAAKLNARDRAKAVRDSGECYTVLDGSQDEECPKVIHATVEHFEPNQAACQGPRP